MDKEERYNELNIASHKEISTYNGYRRRKKKRCSEFKSPTRLIIFHFALSALRKASTHLFST